MMSGVLYDMDEYYIYYVSGRAVRSHIYLIFEVTNTPGVLYVTHPPDYFTCIIYTRNVGSNTLPHFDV